MIRKFYILPLIFVFGLSFCLTNGFAEINKYGELIEEINDVDNIIKEGNFDFPTPDGPAYIQGNAEVQKTLDNIIGPNDFEKMRNLPSNSRDYILGTKVGMIFVPSRFNPRRGFVCTGFLVGPDLFMTNHHCIHDDFGLLPLGGSQIYMDYYQEPSVDPRRGGVTAGVVSVLRADAPKDYALLRLDRPIGNTYGWLELDTTTRVNSSQSVKLISHPQGRSKEIVRRNSRIVDVPPGHPLHDVPYALAYLADSEGGSSGSPVFLRDGTTVIAIHNLAWTSRGEPIYNSGNLMSYIVPEIRQWLPDGPPTPPTPPTPTETQMYWSDVGADKIQRANLNGSNIQNLVTKVKPSGIALDVQGDKMYWTNDLSTGKIQRADLNGSNIEDLVTTGASNFGDIELDIAGGKMYWTDWGRGRIQRANLDGSNVQNLITRSIKPNNIALDVANGKMYWTDNRVTAVSQDRANKIQRANLDGSNVQDLITGLAFPIGIALDVANGKMYWVDTRADKIQRANLDGSNIQDLIRGLDHPNCITLDVAGGKMYWTELNAGKIQRANLNGSNIEDLIRRGLNNPRNIALGIPSATTPPSPPLAFKPPTVANQTFTVGQAVRLQLPAATGGTRPYSYTLTPQLPAGLYFDPVGDAYGLIGGTPTTPMSQTRFTYTATDTKRASVSLNFTIKVVAGGIDDDPLDVNGDGKVTVVDLAIVALFYGTQVPAGTSLPADVNSDGTVNLLDLTAVANGIDAAGGNSDGLSLEDIEAVLAAAAEQAEDFEEVAEAPMGFSTRSDVLSSGNQAYVNVSNAYADARHLAVSDVLSAFLELLAEMGATPETTVLLPNYPNPFNPETWIPYHLATDADVTLTIYDVRGGVVRTLALGHQVAGVYQSRGRAAYWDGKNQLGEKVASGVYFYSLTAGEFTATRKLLIAK